MNTSTCSSDVEVTVGFARQLVDRLSSRRANEKRELVLFLIELAEFDAKKLALELGYPSTLGCLMRELGLTETSAGRRIAAARLLARFPQIAPYLLASRLTLSGLVALKDVLDESNVEELLEQAVGLSESDVRQLAWRIRLQAASSSTIAESAPGQLALATALAAAAAADQLATSHEGGSIAESSAAAPGEDLKAVTLWVGRAFCEELAAVGALLSHAVPSGKREDVLLHALRAQRKVLERRRYGSARRPTVPAVPANANARYMPARLRREVYDREGGTCAFVGDEGRRCCSKRQLEYQHITPVARGGRTTADNLTLFCRAHNLLQAEKDFGSAYVTQRRAVSALTNLGYKRAQAEHAVRQAPQTADLGTLVRECLRLLQ